MNTMMRRSVIGAIAGALSSTALLATGENPQRHRRLYEVRKPRFADLFFSQLTT
jgi:hypothetical protein